MILLYKVSSKLETASNDDLELFDKWLKCNKLSLNVAWTKSILICTKLKKRILEGDINRTGFLVISQEEDQK